MEAFDLRKHGVPSQPSVAYNQQAVVYVLDHFMVHTPSLRAFCCFLFALFASGVVGLEPNSMFAQSLTP